MNAKALRSVLAILLAALLVSLDAGRATAQSGPVTGVVASRFIVYQEMPPRIIGDNFGTPLPGAVVRFSSSSSGLANKREAITDNQGMVTFRDEVVWLKDQYGGWSASLEYSVEVSAPGYRSYSQGAKWGATTTASSPPGDFSEDPRRIWLDRLAPGAEAPATPTPRPTDVPAPTTVAITSTPEPTATPAITSTPEPAPTPTPTPAPTPRTNVTSGCRSCPALAGEPVDTSTGEYILGPLDDLDLGGPLPLSFSRYYASRLKEEGFVNSALGPNWMHNFDYYVLLENDVTQATVVYDRGNFIAFRKRESGGVANWEMQNTAENREEREYQLRQEGNGDLWFMDPRRSLVYRFGPVGDVWRLLRVMDRNNNTLTLNYDGATQKLAQVSDGLGRALSFGYDGAGRLAQVGDGVRTLSYSYADGLLAGYTDPLGNVTGYEYDARTSDALLTSVRQPLGNRRHNQSYDESGRVVSQTDAQGNTTTFSYDTAARTTTITDALGRSRTNRHSEAGVLTEETDAEGRVTTVGLDERGRSTSVTDRLGTTTTMGYDAEGGMPATMTDAGGARGGFQYSSQEQAFGGVSFTFRDMSGVDYPDGSREELAFDDRGNLVKREDPAGNTTAYTYNSRGQLLTETNPSGGVVTSSYNPDGTLASVRDSETGAMTYEYDGLKRVTKANWPDGSSLRTRYDANNRVLSQTDENGSTASYSYDANGNLLTLADALGQVTRYEYDLMDRPVRTTDRLGKVSTASYTHLGRTATWTDPNGNSTTFGYDEKGRLVEVTDGDGKQWQMGYDAEDRKTSETTPLGRISRHEYDSVGNLTKSTTPLGNSSTFGFDARSRMASATDSLGRTVRFRYDALGYLAGISPFGLGSASYTRDPFGQLTGLSDLRGKNWRFTTTPMGRVATNVDPLDRRTSYSYDNQARLFRVAHPTGETQTFTYDPAGNVTRIQYSDGTDITSSYDALGRLTSANGLTLAYDAESNVASTRDGAVEFGATYDDGSRLKTVAYNNGAFTVTYSYDRRNNLVGVADDLTGTALTLDYDDDGRLTGIGRPNGVATTYTWDDGNRITRIRDGALADQQYGYNAASEVTRASQRLPNAGARPAPQSVTLTYDDAGQVNAAGYAYDARGRMTSAPGRSFTWDGASSLTAVGGATLGYNGLGDLRRRAEGGTTVHYHYNRAIGMNPIVAEQQEEGAFLRYYVWTPDGNLLYMIDAANGNRVYFYHFDQYGSTLFLTDASGAVTDSYAYTPYGLPLAHRGANPQPFTFIGRLGVRQEGDGRLYHVRARYYDALTARFLSRDSAWPRVDSWAGLNPYLYARANPLKFVDPTGRSPTFLVSWIIKAVAKVSEKAAGRLAMKAISKGISITAQEGLKHMVTSTAMSAARAEMDRLKDKVVDAALESLAQYEANHSGDWGDFANDLLDPVSVFRDARDVSDLYAIVDVLAAVEAHEQGSDAGVLLHAIEAAVKDEESLSQGSLYSGKVGRAAMDLVLAEWATQHQKDLEELFCLLEQWGIDTVDELLFFLRNNGQHPSPDVNSPQSDWWRASGRIRAYVEYLRQRGSRAAIVVLFDDRQRRKSAPQGIMW